MRVYILKDFDVFFLVRRFKDGFYMLDDRFVTFNDALRASLASKEMMSQVNTKSAQDFIKRRCVMSYSLSEILELKEMKPELFV